MKLLLSISMAFLAIGCSNSDRVDFGNKPISIESAIRKLNTEESKALEVAKREIAIRESWPGSAEYEIENDGKQWNVIVWRLPKTPGGVRYITIDPSGDVTEYTKGL